MKKDFIAKYGPKMSRLRRWLPAMAQLLVLIVIALLLLLPASLTPNLSFAGYRMSDLMLSHWPTALIIKGGPQQGDWLPLWNPYFGGGLPLAADPLAALFYPPTHLVHFLSLRHYFLVLITGHLVFAGLGMLLLARRVAGLTRLPALVAALSFMATPRLLSHLGAGHITVVQTVSWFPWLALGCWATIRNPGRWGALFGLCVALTLLAGHPQIAYYGLLMTAVFAAWLLLKRWRPQARRTTFLALAGLVGAVLIGVLVAAVHLLPLIELTANSTRQLAVNADDSYPLHSFLRALVDPRPRGVHPWESILTPGLPVLILALLAVALRWRQLWPLVLGILPVAGLAMGDSSLIFHAFSHILPGFDRFREPARIWFVALLIIALLAGYGTESLLQSLQQLSFRYFQGERGRILAGGFLALLVMVTLLVADRGYSQPGDIRLTTVPSRLALVVAPLAGSGRVYDLQDNISQENAVQLQLDLADGWDPLLIQSYVSYMNKAGGYHSLGYQVHVPEYDVPKVQPDAHLLGLMDVTIVLSRRLLTDPQLVLVGSVGKNLIYRNLADAGPGYLLGLGPGGQLPAPGQEQLLPAQVSQANQGLEEQTYSFTAATSAYFVIATPAYPGWNIIVDGHTVTALQFAGVMPAIKVGPGLHSVVYRYSPNSVRKGAMLSGLGLLAVLAWFTARWRQRKKERTQLSRAIRLETLSALKVEPHLPC